MPKYTPEPLPGMARARQVLPVVPHTNPVGYTNPAGHNTPNLVPQTPQARSPRMGMGNHTPLVSREPRSAGYTEEHEQWVPTERLTTYQQGVDRSAVDSIANKPDSHMLHLPAGAAKAYIADDGEVSHELYDGNHRASAGLIKGQLIHPVVTDVVKEGPTMPSWEQKQRGMAGGPQDTQTDLQPGYLGGQWRAQGSQMANRSIPPSHKRAGDPSVPLT